MAAQRSTAVMTVIRSVPTLLLRLAGILVYHLGFANLVIRLRRRAPRVIAYHACEPTENAFTCGLACNTTPELFARHLAFISAHYHVVPLSSIVSAAPERALAITFDDAYHSVYEYALPLLRQHRCAATVFVVTDAIDSASLVWVNELTWLLNVGGEPARRAAAGSLGMKLDAPIAAIVERARERCAANCHDLLELLARAASIQRPAGGSDLYLSWTDAAEMSAVGITFGNHTAAHPDLTRLDARAQREEILRARRSLESHLPPRARLSALAYPFGAHDSSTREAAASCGIQMALAIGGSNDFNSPVQLARTPAGQASVARLFADLEIVEPAKASARRLVTRLSRWPLRRQRDWRSPSAERRVPDAPQV